MPIPAASVATGARRSGEAAGRRAVPPALLLVVLAVLVGACRIGVVANVDIDGDGAGALAVVVELDRATADQLRATGVQLAPIDQPGWSVESTDTSDAVTVTLATTFENPDHLAARVAELREGLDDEDPSLLDSIDLEVVDGTIALDASAGLHLPSSAGADIDGWPTGDELAELAATNEVTARLVVTAPGPIVVADGAPADVDGSTVGFELPVGGVAQLTVTSRDATIWDTPLWTLAGVLGGVLLAGVAAVLLVRRRRARRDAPLGRVKGMIRRA